MLKHFILLKEMNDLIIQMKDMFKKLRTNIKTNGKNTYTYYQYQQIYNTISCIIACYETNQIYVTNLEYPNELILYIFTFYP